MATDNGWSKGSRAVVDDKATGTLTDRPWRDGTAMVTAAAIPSGERGRGRAIISSLDQFRWAIHYLNAASSDRFAPRCAASRRRAPGFFMLFRQARTFAASTTLPALLSPRASAHKSPARSCVKPANATAYCAPVSLPSRQTTRQIRDRTISAREQRLCGSSLPSSREAEEEWKPTFFGKIPFFSRLPFPALSLE